MKTRVVILAGGEGTRLSVLTAKRTKPAVPFAGKYRIIDVALSHCVNSSLCDVMIIAQYRPHSLIEHIGAGGPWDLNRDFTGGVRIYTPYRAKHAEWFLGTADAVQQNFVFVKSTNPDLVLILSGDHIYKMNYASLINHHLSKNADVTLTTIKVPIEEASRFGIINTDEDERVVSFIEKPEHPQSNLVNMGVYSFNSNVLDQALWQDHLIKESSHDFGKDIIPALVKSGARVYSYYYAGYWMDVGTLESYWQAHMGLLETPPSLELNDRGWIIHTKTEERSPARIETGAVVDNSLICDGCVLESGSKVIHSILSPGVRVSKNSIIQDSIILTDTSIGSESVIHQSIVDKKVTIGTGVRMGAPLLDTLKITVIGRNAFIPDGTTIESNVTIGTDVHGPDLPLPRIPFGTTIYTRRLPNEL